MNTNLFAAEYPGSLVPIVHPKQDWAFIPDELPAKWPFPDVLWPLLVEARSELGTLNGIGQTLPEPALLLRPLQSREAIASSQIEGTYVTPEQLLLYQLDPREPRSIDDKTADWKEVFSYSKALNHGMKQLQSLPICSRVIREMHRVLMEGVRGRHKTPGEFRRLQVQIGSNGRFVPPPPGELSRLMDNLEVYINAPPDDIDPLVRCFIVHYQFEAIHPFGDGNGRVGRALLALMIQQRLRHAMPWLYLSAFFAKSKDDYIQKLFRVSTHGEWTPWIEYCLRATIAQAKDSVRRCHQFNRLRFQFHKRVESVATARTHALIESLFGSPVISISSVAKQFSVSYPTARDDVRKLVDTGILTELASHHPRSFYFPELIEVAHGESPEDST